MPESEEDGMEEEQQEQVRLLIVDDHMLFAEVIKSTLESIGMTVVDVVTNGFRALETFRRERPDLVLLDLGLPDAHGLAIGRTIIEESPDTKVIAVTASTDPRAVSEALRLGFAGFITKDTPVSQFVSSIRAVLEGQVVVPRQMARHVGGARSKEEEQAALLAQQLTPREREVLELLAKGASSSQMARELTLSMNTVRTHVQSVLNKLGAHSRLEAAAFAVRYGIVKVQQERDAGGGEDSSGTGPGEGRAS
jgi:DNA-binding NarL/FixJ family response regulator